MLVLQDRQQKIRQIENEIRTVPLQRKNLEAQLALAQGGQRETAESLTGANAKVMEARASIAQAGAKIADDYARVAQRICEPA